MGICSEILAALSYSKNPRVNKDMVMMMMMMKATLGMILQQQFLTRTPLKFLLCPVRFLGRFKAILWSFRSEIAGLGPPYGTNSIDCPRKIVHEKAFTK